MPTRYREVEEEVIDDLSSEVRARKKVTVVNNMYDFSKFEKDLETFTDERLQMEQKNAEQKRKYDKEIRKRNLRYKKMKEQNLS